MIHTKRVIFMILPLLSVPLVYGISSTPDACAAPQDPGYQTSKRGTLKVSQFKDVKTCCWREKVPGQILGKEYCQTCTTSTGSGETVCDEKKPKALEPPTTGEGILPGQGGAAEQPEQPLFGGQNDAGVPPTGGIEQPPTATTQPTPGGGADAPTEGGSAEQPSTPQDDTQGGGLPTIKNEENVPPGGGVAEQPEEDDGQEGTSEGAPTAGPLT
jgi:hypothetical protein